jgi:hypothetical protein
MEATMTIDPAVVTSILALFGIGLIPVINFLKKLMGLEGKPALLLVLACSAAGTAIILLTTGAFAWLALIVYTVAVWGEASGLYKFTARTT